VLVGTAAIRQALQQMIDSGARLKLPLTCGFPVCFTAIPTWCAISCPACVPLSRVMHVTLSMSAAARWLKECRCEPVHSSAREA
jgi:hypothetical protein